MSNTARPKDRPEDRRKRPRLQPKKKIALAVYAGSWSDRAVLLDLSDLGLGIEMNAPMELGTTLQVEMHQIKLLGSVVNCFESKRRQYRLGIELLEAIPPTEWKKLLEECAASAGAVAV